MNEMRKLMETISAIEEDKNDAYSVGYGAGLKQEASAFAAYQQWCAENPGVASEEAARKFVRGYNDGKQLNMDNTQGMLEADEQAQAANPVDTVAVDIPLLIRLLEFSREDAKTDMDLHQLANNMINLSPDGNTLTMADYEELVAGLAGKEDETSAEEEDEYAHGGNKHFGL